MLENGKDITIEYAEGLNNEKVESCNVTEWNSLENYTDNSEFRSLYENYTLNRVNSNGEKEGTIYTESNPTLKTSISNKAFVNYIDGITVEQYGNMLKSVYSDLSSNDSQDTLKRAAINSYFNLFNTKGTKQEYNANEKVSRVDFMSALAKAITPYDENKEFNEDFVNKVDNTQERDCARLASLVVDKSYLGAGADSINYSDTGKITKIEAIDLIVKSLYSESEINNTSNTNLKNVENAGNIAEDKGYTKVCRSDGKLKSAVLRYCIANNKHDKLDDRLYKSLNKAVQEGIV